MKIRELAEKMDLEPLSLPDGDREVEGFYAGDLLSWVMGRANAGNVWFTMGRAQSGDLWITIMSNVNVLAVASLVDLSAVVLAEGVTLSEKDIASAEEKGINVFTSGKSTYELCALAGELAK